MPAYANNDGYCRKDTNGLWSVRIADGFTPKGERNVLTFAGASRTETQQKIRHYFEEKARRSERLGADMPFSHWADIWYEGYKDRVQPSTYSNYRYTLQTLQEYFRDTPLCDIRQLNVNAFLSSLEKRGYSASKVTKCKAMLIQIFAEAEANELVCKNPAANAQVRCGWEDECELFGEEEVLVHSDAFTEEEYENLMRYLPEDLLGNSIRTLLVSGIRVQELLALTPADIAQDGSYINIRRAVKMVDGKAVLGTPKSRRSRRRVPIPEGVRSCVRYLRDHSGARYIWTSSRNENALYTVGGFRNMYYRAVKKIPAVRRLTPHCCRHTYVTRLQAGGVPMELIARLAGHRSPTMTDVYAHASPETLAEAVSVLERRTEQESP